MRMPTAWAISTPSNPGSATHPWSPWRRSHQESDISSPQTASLLSVFGRLPPPPLVSPSQVQSSTNVQTGGLVAEMLKRRQALDQDDDDSDEDGWDDD